MVVSCVTKDPPYRPHPHNLVGKEVCKQGVCTVEVNSENMTVSFDKLGIQCVKRKDIEDALNLREKIRVDPFRSNISVLYFIFYRLNLIYYSIYIISFNILQLNLTTSVSRQTLT